jgi:hypothetical protein
MDLTVALSLFAAANVAVVVHAAWHVRRSYFRYCRSHTPEWWHARQAN